MSGALSPRKQHESQDGERAKQHADIFGIDVLKCSRCQGQMRLIACIEQPDVAKKIFEHAPQRTRAKLRASTPQPTYPSSSRSTSFGIICLVDGAVVGKRVMSVFHGTSVAGIVAGDVRADDSYEPNGLKVLPVAGVSAGDLLTGFEAAVDVVCKQRDAGVQVRVVSMSLASYEAADPIRHARWLRAVDKLAERGIVLVVAGANPNDNGRVGYPGKLGLGNVVVVSDVADVQAVGKDGKRGRVVGTSFGAPLVAKRLAQKLRDNPNTTVADAVRDGRALRVGLSPWEVRLP